MKDSDDYKGIAGWFLSIRERGPTYGAAFRYYWKGTIIYLGMYAIMLPLFYFVSQVLFILMLGVLLGSLLRYNATMRRTRAAWPFYRAALDWKVVEEHAGVAGLPTSVASARNKTIEQD